VLRDLGVSYTETNLALPRPQTGMVVAGCGLLGVVFLLSFKQLGRLFDDVELILYGIGVMVLGCLLMIRRIWTGLVANDLDFYATWLTAMISMYGVGYPVGHTAVIGWFSKAMKQRPQNFLLGIFGSAGSLVRIGVEINKCLPTATTLSRRRVDGVEVDTMIQHEGREHLISAQARIVFPVCTGFIATHYSADAVFAVLAGLLGVTLTILVVFRDAFREAIA